MYEALGEHATVVPIPVSDLPHHVVDRAATRAIDGHRGRHYLPAQGVLTSRVHGSQLTRRIAQTNVDVVVAVAASHSVAYVATGVPVVQVSDASLALVIDYYGLFTDLHWSSRIQARRLASRTGRRTDRFVLASQWAADSMLRDYGVSARRVTVAPFGPSVVPLRPRPSTRVSTPLRLLTVASNWERKGGDRALAVFARLQSLGVPTSLTVVGDSPALPPGVHGLGRVERAEMSDLYLGHDVLLEPARANAGGVTLTDAAVHGLPAVATGTGGVPTIVEHDVSGLLVPQESVVESSAQAILRLTDNATWSRLSSGATNAAAGRLSWAHWGEIVSRACHDALNNA